MALMAVGGLITLLCGSCTLTYLGSALWYALSKAFHHGPLSNYDAEGAEMAPLVAVTAVVIGGLPTALGIFVLLSGLRTYRRAKQGAASENDG